MNPSTSTATLAGNLSALAEPVPALMDAPALDYFFIEMVNTLRDSSAVAISRTKKIEEEMAEAGLLPPAPPATTAAAKRESARDSISSMTPKADGKSEFTERRRLLGYGWRILECTSGLMLLNDYPMNEYCFQIL
ncbi:hypothetical protein QCA50_008355 [Cerrena zonata]|uniref:Uncharacterized protein n=1 Tax=Cerrena zonata TaxID=2478898 RepID=A0AAW0GG52_9APHY